METKTYLDEFIQQVWLYGPKIMTAALILVAGFWLIRRLSAGFQNVLNARKIDESLRPFFASMVDIVLKISLLLVVAGQLGLETTSFIAVFSAIAFAVGLALQGSLGNFASGVLILIFRPYKVGDLITVSGLSGRVTEIQIFSTLLLTTQGKKIIIPNGKMTDGPIENIGDQAEIQAEVCLLLNASTSLELLRRVSAEVGALCPTGLCEKPTEVKISGITRDDMKADIACWTSGVHYEETIHYLYEALLISFKQHGIELAKERRKESI